MSFILLTGHRGFIGSQILRELTSADCPPSLRGIPILAADPLTLPPEYYATQAKPAKPAKQATPASPIPDVTPFTCYPEEIHQDLLSQVTHVINCGAETHVDRSYGNPHSFHQANVLSPKLLASYLNPGTTFLQVSTDEVFKQEKQPFSETSEHEPSNPYAQTKSLAESELRALCQELGIKFGITNGANTYGPGQYWEKIIPKTIYNALNGVKIPLYQTPAQRMWLHVQDHARGILKALEATASGSFQHGQNFCLAPDLEDELYTHDLVSMILAILDLDPSEHISLVPDRPNYDLRYYMLNDFAKTALNWSPERHIKNELKNVVLEYANLYKN